jgi:hypothetical protein
MRCCALSAAALLLPLALAGCGADDGHGVASDPAPTSATSTPTPTPTAGPTVSPTVGSYPQFAATDYTYQLTVQCFCAFAGTPVEVTVADGEVVGGIYARDDGGRQETHAGDPAPNLMWLTINDVIAKANATSAARVTVDWPAGQDYPNSVFVDQSKDMADDEVGYTISDVRVR